LTKKKEGYSMPKIQRAPFQVLVLPYYIITARRQIEYAIFRRKDIDIWQGIAGGGNAGENSLEAAKRESLEEGQISSNNQFIKLDSKATIPVKYVVGDFLWGLETYVIPEYCFGVHVKEQNIIISKEHVEFNWVSFDKAMEMLKWDSNKNALWELNERLHTNGTIIRSI
jgi:dATP pyrophosphohydrolase